MDRLIIIAIVVVAAAVAAVVLFGGGGQNQNPTIVQAGKSATITLTEYALNPNRLVMDHGRVKLTVINRGKSIHEFILHDPVLNQDIGKLPFLRPGATEILWVDLIAFRRYEMYDSVYKEKGMQGVLNAR